MFVRRQNEAVNPGSHANQLRVPIQAGRPGGGGRFAGGGPLPPLTCPPRPPPGRLEPLPGRAAPPRPTLRRFVRQTRSRIDYRLCIILDSGSHVGLVGPLAGRPEGGRGPRWVPPGSHGLRDSEVCRCRGVPGMAAGASDGHSLADSCAQPGNYRHYLKCGHSEPLRSILDCLKLAGIRERHGTPL